MNRPFTFLVLTSGPVDSSLVLRTTARCRPFLLCGSRKKREREITGSSVGPIDSVFLRSKVGSALLLTLKRAPFGESEGRVSRRANKEE